MRENEFNAKLAELTKRLEFADRRIKLERAAWEYESRRAAIYRGALQRLLNYVVETCETEETRDFADDGRCPICDGAVHVEIIAARAVLDDPRYL